MSWQDWVFTVGGLVMLLTLVPTIRGEQKPAVATSVGNVGIVLVFAGAFVSLGLWFSVVMNIFIAIAWAILGFQRWRQGYLPDGETPAGTTGPSRAGQAETG